MPGGIRSAYVPREAHKATAATRLQASCNVLGCIQPLPVGSSLLLSAVPARHLQFLLLEEAKGQ